MSQSARRVIFPGYYAAFCLLNWNRTCRLRSQPFPLALKIIQFLCYIVATDRRTCVRARERLLLATPRRKKIF